MNTNVKSTLCTRVGREGGCSRWLLSFCVLLVLGCQKNIFIRHIVRSPWTRYQDTGLAKVEWRHSGRMCTSGSCICAIATKLPKPLPRLSPDCVISVGELWGAAYVHTASALTDPVFGHYCCLATVNYGYNGRKTTRDQLRFYLDSFTGRLFWAPLSFDVNNAYVSAPIYFKLVVYSTTKLINIFSLCRKLEKWWLICECKVC